MICWGSVPKVSSEGGKSFLFLLIQRQELPFSMSLASSPAINPSLAAVSSGFSAKNSWMVPVGKTLFGKQTSTGPKPKPSPEAIGTDLNPSTSNSCCLSLSNISCFSAVIVRCQFANGLHMTLVTTNI